MRDMIGVFVVWQLALDAPRQADEHGNAEAASWHMRKIGRWVHTVMVQTFTALQCGFFLCNTMGVEGPVRRAAITHHEEHGRRAAPPVLTHPAEG